jgi:tetratricopeptide (TPR) repeat protein
MNCNEAPLLEYLDGELDEAGTEAVLTHLETCQTCRERLQVMAALRAGYEAEPERRGYPRVWLMAAGILAALLGPLLYFQLRSPTPIDLAELATSTPYSHFPLVTRSGDDAQHTETRRRAFAAYDRGDYRAAELEFSQLPGDAETLFYSGVTTYFLGKHAEAVAAFSKAVELDRRWKAPALWYRAAAHLRTGERDAARRDLQELLNSENEFQNRARQLLERLGQPAHGGE